MSCTLYVVIAERSLRTSTATALRQLGYTVRIYRNGKELLAMGELEQGCILLDVHIPAMGGLEVHRELLRRGITLPTIFLDGDVPLAVKAMQQGAVDFVEKPFTMEEIVPVIERAHALGQEGELARELQSLAAARLKSLTPRGKQILQGMQAGMANKSIARWLNLSPRTVEVYRATMMAKIGVTKLSEALRVARDGGLPELNSTTH